MTRPAGRYLDALARAAGWAGSDPGLPARPRPRSRFEPDPGDGGSAWLLGVQDVRDVRDVRDVEDTEDELPSAVPDDVSPPVDRGRGDPEGSDPDRTPVTPVAPPAVAVAARAVAPPDVPPVRVEAVAAGGPPRTVDPGLPGRPDAAAVPGLVVAVAPTPPDPGDPPPARPLPAAAARPVPVPDGPDLDDRRPPGEPGGGRPRAGPDLRDGEPGGQPRPRATARPAPAVVVDDPLVRPAEAAIPPPVIIEIGRIEVRVAAGGPVVGAAPSRPALLAPGPSLADYLDGLAGAAGRSGKGGP